MIWQIFGCWLFFSWKIWRGEWVIAHYNTFAQLVKLKTLSKPLGTMQLSILILIFFTCLLLWYSFDKLLCLEIIRLYPAGIYLFKVINRNLRTTSEICSKLIINDAASFCVFIVNFEHISHFVLLFILLTLNI